jgi:hypothetical protein
LPAGGEKAAGTNRRDQRERGFACRTRGEQIRLEHAAIAKAKLVITDELLAKLEEERTHE